MLTGRTFIGVLNLQNTMYIYHSTLKATRPVSSPWYTWPFLFDPSISNALSNVSPRIYNWTHVPFSSAQGLPTVSNQQLSLGNPAVWWVGFAAIVGLTVYYVPKFYHGKFDFKENLPVVFILVYLLFPVAALHFHNTSQSYIYHFYCSVPILCLGVAFFVNKYWSNNWVKIAAVAYFAATIGLFVLFYPIISGVPTINLNNSTV